jgi:hypothetical protein
MGEGVTHRAEGGFFRHVPIPIGLSFATILKAIQTNGANNLGIWIATAPLIKPLLLVIMQARFAIPSTGLTHQNTSSIAMDGAVVGRKNHSNPF